MREGTFGNTNQNKNSMLKVLFFQASWCMPCKSFGPIVDEVVSNQGGVTYQKVDIDSSPDLVNKYGITSVPTLVLEKNGSVVARSTGAKSKAQLTSFVDSYK
jgi:thioredoxin 1